jgi:hypothetical protein
LRRLGPGFCRIERGCGGEDCSGGGSSEVAHRWDQVDEVSGSVAEFAFAGHAFGPVNDRGRGNASFVNPGFVETEGSVCGGGPAGGGFGVVAVVSEHLLGTRSVVGYEDKYGVAIGIHSAELVEDAADLLVHTVDHCGVDGHFGSLEGLLL